MGKRVLVVDDSMFIMEEIRHILRDTEFEIAGWAKDGENAIELYERLKPDVVTMDIILPGIDGLETAKIILQKSPEAKIIMVSSLAYDDTMSQSKDIGACDFIFKPFEENQLIEVLTRASTF